MFRTRYCRSRRRRGVALIWTAIFLSMLIALAGLATDLAFGLLVGHQLQNAADAASLAGAQSVRDDSAAARLAALTIAEANQADKAPVLLTDNPSNDPAGDIVIGRYDRKTRTFAPGVGSPNAVKVVARRVEGSRGGPVGLVFGPLFGVNTVPIRRTAIAMIGGGTGAGLITLNDKDKWTFRMDGNITLDVRDSTSADGYGTIQVNSTSTSAMKTDGQPTLIASELNCCADSLKDPPDFEGDVNTSMPYVPDPLGHIDEPTNWPPGEGGLNVSGGNHRLTPTHYTAEGIPIMYLPQGIRQTGGTITLDPGIYVVDGVGLNIGGNGNFYANGVMIHVVGQGSVNLVGTGAMEFTGLDMAYEPYGGISIWQARDNTNTATIRGTGQFDGIDGSLYFPAAQVDIAGTSDSFGIRQLICDSVELSGNGTLYIDYDGRFPAPGAKVFLVR